MLDPFFQIYGINNKKYRPAISKYECTKVQL